MISTQYPFLEQRTEKEGEKKGVRKKVKRKETKSFSINWPIKPNINVNFVKIVFRQIFFFPSLTLAFFLLKSSWFILYRFDVFSKVSLGFEKKI